MDRDVIKNHLILDCITGSVAYGMSTPASDEDRRGIFIAWPGMALSPFNSTEQVEGLFGNDSVHYELKKFTSLLAKQNPNIVELLWVEEEFIKLKRWEYDELRNNREMFLDKHVFQTYIGYANSQLARIKSHSKWINNPQPARRPKEVDYVSTVYNSTNIQEWNTKPPTIGFAYHLGGEMYGLDLSTHAYTDPSAPHWLDIHEAIKPEEGTLTNHKFDIFFKFNKQQYKEAVENWKQYWEWKKNRNEIRSELEEKYGYDTKHAKIN